MKTGKEIRQHYELFEEPLSQWFQALADMWNSEIAEKDATIAKLKQELAEMEISCDFRNHGSFPFLGKRPRQ